EAFAAGTSAAMTPSPSSSKARSSTAKSTLPFFPTTTISTSRWFLSATACENVGILNEGGPNPHAQGTFPSSYLQRVQSLVVQLVRAGLSFEIRPFVLGEMPNSHFMGKVLFPEGWAVGAGAREIAL